jgi:foldase protein PrsA
MEKTMKKYWRLGLLLVLAVLACSRKDEVWLVKVGDSTLSEDVVSRRYKMSREYAQHPVVTAEVLKQFIEKNLLNMLYFQAEGVALKLDQDSTIALQLTQEERRLLTRNGGPLFKAIVPATFPVTDQEVQTAYEWGKQECKISHILVKSPGLADSIHSALTNGADFGAMVQKYSMDVNTLATGGQIGPYLTWFNLAPAAAEAIRHTAVGSFTRPIRTGYGYQILRVDERRDRKQPAIEQARAEIESNLKSQKQGTVIEEYSHELYQKFNLKVDSLVFVRIAPALHNAKPGEKVNWAMISPEDQNSTLMQHDGAKWSVRETLSKFEQMTRGTVYQLTRYEDVVDFVQKASIQDLMVLDAKARKLDQTPEFKKEYINARDQILGQKCRERLVTRSIRVLDEEVADYYQAHQAEFNGRTIAEVRPTILSRLQSARTTELQDKVMADLRKKHSEKWNDKELQKTAEAVNAEKSAAAATRGPSIPDEVKRQIPAQRPGQVSDPAPAAPQGVRPR